jgi:hypothetical protein
LPSLALCFSLKKGGGERKTVIRMFHSKYSKFLLFCWQMKPRVYMQDFQVKKTDQNKFRATLHLSKQIWMPSSDLSNNCMKGQFTNKWITNEYITCRCLYFLWRAAIMRPSSVHAVTSSSSPGKLSFSITRLWYLPAVKGLQKVYRYRGKPLPYTDTIKMKFNRETYGKSWHVY